MKATKIRSLLLCCALGLGVPTVVHADDDAVRQQFSNALEQARAGVTPAKADSRQLRDYVLYPYLQAVRIQSQISRGTPGSADQAAASWLQAHPDLPVARELRRQWLLDLADRQDWAPFLANDEGGERDRTLTCYRWQARIATEDPAKVRDDLLAFWSDASQMPGNCNPPFNWLSAQGVVTVDATEKRARKALVEGNTSFAAVLIGQLPDDRAAPLRQWLQLLRDPQGGLDQLVATPGTRYVWPALDAAFSKLSRRDPGAAQAVLAKLDRQQLSPEQYDELARAVALGYSWDRDARALPAFQMLPEAAVDDAVREWRIRAALWNGDWQLAAGWLQALPPAMASSSRWSYWRARVAEKLGQNDVAKAQYAALAKDDGYYSVLAAWRLGARYEPPARTLDEDRGVQKHLLEQSPALLRARELYRVHEIRWANAEWYAGTQALDPAQTEQAALMASRWGWHLQAVILLSRLSIYNAFDVLYPKKIYADAIHQAAKHSGLPPAWIYGVMRQESLFMPNAVSGSDALGLLQLKLGTARDAARRAGLPRPDRDDLFDPKTNIALGSAYLRQMTDRYGGQFVLTVASYNAGPNAVARWLPDAPLDADVWIENVPYNETRQYVERIAWHIAVHDWQTNGKIRDFDDLLQPVRGASS
ncbi:lytic transglycosylase domain-containing protein [Solimonas marina]|uniref:Transglycosylase SLT domain-containing protein n=1 Tax=Solimonas marina TaxID=2714601 RepID=A0A969W9E9_9GAMM|nr:lytic transglycosylase domain-containing protein [Solimonas marina]NKF21955.1 transglycosylase SLT domain-containing protein [Solimonas marina]